MDAESKNDLIDQLQNYASEDMWGIFEPRDKGYFFFSHKGTLPTKANINFYGLWYSSQEIEPSADYLISFILSHPKELIFFGPEYTAHIRKTWDYPHEHEGASYVKSVASHTFEIFNTLGIDADIDFFVEQRAMWELRRRFGNQLKLNTSYDEMWLNYCNIIGLKVTITDESESHTYYPEKAHTRFDKLNKEDIKEQVFDDILNSDLIESLKKPEVIERIYQDEELSSILLSSPKNLRRLQGIVGLVSYPAYRYLLRKRITRT